MGCSTDGSEAQWGHTREGDVDSVRVHHLEDEVCKRTRLDIKF